MSIGIFVAALIAFVSGAVLGIVFTRSRERARLRRLHESVRQLAQGNLAHRVIMPGSREMADMADDINRLADRIQEERERAARREEARRQLVANISHDLRTPITSIAGFVDALRRGLGDEPDRYLAVIGAKAEELAALTDDLFYAARLDSDELELANERVDIAEAVRRSVLGFEPELMTPGATVELEIPEQPCIVDADPSAVARILSNLISNSIRHGESMTRFAVRLTRRDEHYELSLRNDGATLPDDVDRLFERGVAGPGGGAGLGLSIARQLAERMGGSVTACNTSGGGVAFTLVFPASHE